MGWGCYKHEWDAGSTDWKTVVFNLCDRKLKDNPRTFGRDGEVCPKCFEELEKQNKKLHEVLKDLSRAVNSNLDSVQLHFAGLNPLLIEVKQLLEKKQ